MSKITRRIAQFFMAFLISTSVCVAQPEAKTTPRPVVDTLRLYVLDCGEITNNTPEDFGLTRHEVKYTDFADMCYLLVHPRGTLLFDTGLSDGLVGLPLYATYRYGYGLVVLRTLRSQLAEIGYTPQAIDYLLLSHSHFDHVGNAGMFHGSTWLVQKAEWDYMFPKDGKPAEDAQDFQVMRSMKTQFVTEDYDVFGDGSVVIKRAFGHSPGHNVLAVTLRDTGKIVLGGDLYHYPEERSLHRIGQWDDRPQVRNSRASIDAWVERNHAQLWLTHDMSLFQRLIKAPGYYQ